MSSASRSPRKIRARRSTTGGVTSACGSILDLFAGDAQVYFPKWGLLTGKSEIGKLSAT